MHYSHYSMAAGNAVKSLGEWCTARNTYLSIHFGENSATFLSFVPRILKREYALHFFLV